MKRTAMLDRKSKLVAAIELSQLEGNEFPYFSVTATLYENGRDVAGGCLHEMIAEAWPDLAPVIALHLSDINGVPMHARANGIYWLAGACHGNLQQQYHGANSNPARSPLECLQILAKHLRIDMSEAEALRNRSEEFGPKRALEYFATYVDGQMPRWKTEADAAIAQFNLTVTKG